MKINSQIVLTDAEVEKLKAASLPPDPNWRKRMEDACTEMLKARGIKGSPTCVDIDYPDRDIAVYTLNFTTEVVRMRAAEYRPARGKILAMIVQGGEIICVFKTPPSDEQGHAMADALST